MKRILFTVVLVSVFIGTTVISSLAASEHGAHHPAGTKSASMTSKQGMAQMPCMAAAESGSMSQMMGMMGAGKMGMMEQRMAHMFYLDRADELGLSADQVSKLKTLHMECRKDNIRTAAEVKIARLELADLLATDNWSLQDAESLVRKAQTLEGDIQVRHLQAQSAARKVLTAEQLSQARSNSGDDNIEDLFE